jgi:hypothetical protein
MYVYLCESLVKSPAAQWSSVTDTADNLGRLPVIDIVALRGIVVYKK